MVAYRVEPFPPPEGNGSRIGASEIQESKHQHNERILRDARSAFALRFKTVLGRTPLEYLTTWRMYKAAALIRSSNMSFQRQAIPLSAGDVFISILSDEPFTLVDHPRSRVADYRELRKLEVDCVIHYGGGGAPTTLVNGSFGMNAFEAPLISAILPRYVRPCAQGIEIRGYASGYAWK